MRIRPLWKYAAVLAFLVPAATVRAADEFDSAPILYSQSTPENVISRLQQRLDDGELKLAYKGDQGYLRALLDALRVPVESQMLVFSKTSLQVRRITPETPRAVYFNDDVYVGFCQLGDVLEISAVDSKLGTVFYTLDQQEVERPRFQRHTDNCLICHSSSRTEGVPGHLVRSLYVDAGGQPMLSAGGRVVDHTTPIEERWGGWYVTGTHGAQSHLGNLIISGRNVPRQLDNSRGHNVVDLKGRVNMTPYASPHSDIVALMVLEHQTLVHNRLTRASFATRQALDYDAMMNRALGNTDGKHLESTVRRIQNAGDALVEALLLVGEAKLTGPIAGTSGFAEAFSRAGTRDSRDRSLRDLDLTTRLFKYPCSYLIDSDAFDGLPAEMRDYVWRRLWNVLSGEDRSEKFVHLSEQDRAAIVSILRDTNKDLPDYWQTPRKTAQVAE
jgi:hypothetical protein